MSFLQLTLNPFYINPHIPFIAENIEYMHEQRQIFEMMIIKAFYAEHLFE